MNSKQDMTCPDTEPDVDLDALSVLFNSHRETTDLVKNWLSSTANVKVNDGDLCASQTKSEEINKTQTPSIMPYHNLKTQSANKSDGFKNRSELSNDFNVSKQHQSRLGVGAVSSGVTHVNSRFRGDSVLGNHLLRQRLLLQDNKQKKEFANHTFNPQSNLPVEEASRSASLGKSTIQNKSDLRVFKNKKKKNRLF